MKILLLIGLLALSGCLEPQPEYIEYVTTITFCDKSFAECEDQILFSMFEFCQENINQEFVLDCIATVGNTKITDLGNDVYKVEIPKGYVQAGSTEFSNISKTDLMREIEHEMQEESQEIEK